MIDDLAVIYTRFRSGPFSFSPTAKEIEQRWTASLYGQKDCR